MAEARDRLARAALGGLWISGTAASGLADTPAGLAGAAALGAAAAYRMPFRPGRPLRRAFQWAGDACLLATAVSCFAWTLYPALSQSLLLGAARPLRLALAAFALAALASARRWRPAHTLLPAALGLLAWGAVLPGAERGYPAWAVSAALCVAGYLAAEGPPFERRPLRPRAARLLAFLAATGLLAAGIARFLPWAQPRVEAAAARWLKPRAATAGYAALSPSSRLGDVEELGLSRRPLLRVFTDRPQLLRARVFTGFDGSTWTAEPATGSTELLPAERGLASPSLRAAFEDMPGAVLAVPGAPLDGEDAAVARVVQLGEDLGALPAPARLALISLPSQRGRIDDHGIVTPSPLGPVRLYAVASLPGRPFSGADPGRLEIAAREALEIPAGLSPRIAALAAELGGAAGPTAARVERTLQFLRRHYRYARSGPPRGASDPVAAFLFETRRGYCEYFATAAALLLRLQGVPARYVTGFNVSEHSLVGGHYVVREGDAHAWVEALDGAGWLEHDPTPAAQFAALHARRGGALEGIAERLRSTLDELSARAGSASAGATVLWLARRLVPFVAATAAALALLAVLARRRPRAADAPRSAAADPRLAELLARVDRALRRAGHPRPPARPPGEHLAALPEGAFEPGRRGDLREAVGCFYRARFGGESPPPGELAELLARLARR